MKRLVIGDIHGNIDFLRKLFNTYEDQYRITLVGDLIDSRHFDIEQQYQCIELAYNKSQEDKCDYIIGNHEASYFLPNQKCSGFNEILNVKLLWLKNKNFLKPFIFDEGVLISHAGLTAQLEIAHQITPGNLEEILEKWVQDYNSPYYQIGWYRGGGFKYGGLLWCDFDKEFQPTEISQVFGHTPCKYLKSKSKSPDMGKCSRICWNIDCIEQDSYWGVIVENGTITPIELDFTDPYDYPKDPKDYS